MTDRSKMLRRYPGARAATLREHWRVVLTLIVLAPLVLLGACGTAAPGGRGAATSDSQAAAVWLANDSRSTEAVDNRQWALFLNAYRSVGSDGVARVAYGSLGRTGTAWLDRYVASLADLPITTYRRSEQFAYWVNLYNALTIKLIAAHYPLNSIRDINISRGLVSGPWTRPLINIEGRPVSLDDIQNRILRPGWNDARIHYLLACGAVGCPDLPAQPVSADQIAEQLDAAARAFINHPRGARVTDGALRLSAIYQRYAADFGGSDWDAIQHVRRYAARPLASAMRAASAVDGYDFDWSLNDAR